MMFEPKQYLITMGKNKDGSPRWYLQTAHRVLWFRTEYPIDTGWAILTNLVQTDPYPVVSARVVSPEGVIVATAYGSAQPQSGSVYAGREIEKAETAAVGRALGMAGYGTQFDGDSDDDNLADSPLERVATQKTVTEFVAEQKPDAAKLSVSEQRKENWRKFAAYWNKEAQLNNAKLCEILAVGDLLEYDGSFDDANQAVLEWLEETHEVPA